MNRDEYRAMAAINAKRGRELKHAKLTEESVKAIRENRSGMFAWQQAQAFGVHIRTIEKVRRYETWVHVR